MPMFWCGNFTCCCIYISFGAAGVYRQPGWNFFFNVFYGAKGPFLPFLRYTLVMEETRAWISVLGLPYQSTMDCYGFLTVLELEVQNQGAGGIGFLSLLMLLSLPCRQLSSPVFSYHLPSLCVCTQVSSSYKDASHIGFKCTLMTSS